MMRSAHQIENQYQMPVFSKKEEIRSKSNLVHLIRTHTGFSRLTLQENVPSNISSRLIVA